MRYPVRIAVRTTWWAILPANAEITTLLRVACLPKEVRQSCGGFG